MEYTSVSSNHIRGKIEPMILKLLLDKDLYGSEITKLVQDASGGTYVLKKPTLYSALKRLESKRYVKGYDVITSDGRRRYYKLTELGKNSLMDKKEDWRYTKDVVDTLLYDGIERYRFSTTNYDMHTTTIHESHDVIGTPHPPTEHAPQEITTEHTDNVETQQETATENVSQDDSERPTLLFPELLNTVTDAANILEEFISLKEAKEASETKSDGETNETHTDSLNTSAQNTENPDDTTGNTDGAEDHAEKVKSAKTGLASTPNSGDIPQNATHVTQYFIQGNFINGGSSQTSTTTVASHRSEKVESTAHGAQDNFSALGRITPYGYTPYNYGSNALPLHREAEFNIPLTNTNEHDQDQELKPFLFADTHNASDESFDGDTAKTTEGSALNTQKAQHVGEYETYLHNNTPDYNSQDMEKYVSPTEYIVWSPEKDTIAANDNEALTEKLNYISDRTRMTKHSTSYTDYSEHHVQNHIAINVPPKQTPAPLDVNTSPHREDYIAIKPFTKHYTQNKRGVFILYNKLRACVAGITSALLSIFLAITWSALRIEYTTAERTMFVLAFVAIGIYMLVYLAIFTSNTKHKRLTGNYKREFLIRSAISASLFVVILGINIVSGLSGGNTMGGQAVFIIVPTLLAMTFVLEGVLIYMLKRGKFFSAE